MCRFTIRDLVLVTTIVAMGMSWWVDRRLHQRQTVRWTQELERAAYGLSFCVTRLEDMQTRMNYLERQVEAKQPDWLELRYLVNAAVERQLKLRDEALQPSEEAGKAQDPFSP